MTYTKNRIECDGCSAFRTYDDPWEEKWMIVKVEIGGYGIMLNFCESCSKNGCKLPVAGEIIRRSKELVR